MNCVDCGENFVFSANEADFYDRKDLVKPKRCKPCRKKRKLLRWAGMSPYGH